MSYESYHDGLGIVYQESISMYRARLLMDAVRLDIFAAVFSEFSLQIWKALGQVLLWNPWVVFFLSSY